MIHNFCKLSKNRVGPFLNVTECLTIRGMASASLHTGSAPTTHRTNNGSDVILGDLATQRPF